MSVEKIMRCMSSLSDALGDLCGKIELSVVLHKPFHEVITNLLAPNNVQFIRVDLGDEEEDEPVRVEPEAEDPKSVFVIQADTNSAVPRLKGLAPVLYWSGKEWEKSRDESARYSDEELATKELVRIKRSPRAMLPDSKHYKLPYVNKVSWEGED